MKNIYAFLVIILFVFCVSVFPEVKTKTATIFTVTGDVKVIPMGSSIGIKASKEMKIKQGDWIKTGSGGFATLSFDDNAENVIKIQENSLVIMKLDGYFKIQLLEGKMNAILENVQEGEIFRALTPSVVTESTNSGWAVSSEGNYTTVVVGDGEAYVCGINKDGSVKKEKYIVKEGYGRTTKLYEDPGEMVETPDVVMKWFKDQVVEHHLDKVISKRTKEETSKGKTKSKKEFSTKNKSGYKDLKGKNIVIVDGEEVDLLEFLYRSRLSKEKQENNNNEEN